ncbi:divalent metal cation transporter, partial [Bacillus amyloliquefaciens]
ILRAKNAGRTEQDVSGKSPAYRFYLAWLTFPPMILLFFGRPVELILVYGALGSLFMPFLAISLLLLLNSNLVPADCRNKSVTNA